MDRITQCALTLLLATSTSLVAQAQEDKALLDAARQTIEQARYTALITVDESGQPRSRVVDPFMPDENFVVWIATRPVTRKVEQIRHHKQVTLYYWHEESRSYVTIMGTAELIDDLATRQRLRRDRDNERLYPDFPNDYLLIRVQPTWLEAMVPGFRGDKETWRPHGVRFEE